MLPWLCRLLYPWMCTASHVEPQGHTLAVVRVASGGVTAVSRSTGVAVAVACSFVCVSFVCVVVAGAEAARSMAVVTFCGLAWPCSVWLCSVWVRRVGLAS